MLRPQVLGHVPGPDLDQVAVRVVHVGGPAGALELRLLDLLAERAETLDSRLVVGLGDVHREVHVHAAAAPEQADLRLPESDSRAISRHHPDRLAPGPAVYHREPEYL